MTLSNLEEVFWFNVAVTPPAFCNSSYLQTKLTGVFPKTTYNKKGCYLTEDELIDFLRDADAAIIGRDPICRKVIQALPKLKIIAKYGVGLDNINQKVLQNQGVAFRYSSGVNKRSVAELTVCFILGLCRKVFVGSYELKRQHWFKDGGMSFTGKTLGIVGCGNVGQEVVRLVQPFGCHIMIQDILDKSGFCRQMGAEESRLDDLIVKSDIVSLHVPLNQATHRMINGKVLRQMKSTAYLINTSRGAVVDQEDLKIALQKGIIAGAALDVFENEPPDDLEFLSCPNYRPRGVRMQN